MPGDMQPSERAAQLRAAIIDAKARADELPAQRREKLRERFDAAAEEARRHAEYVRPG